MYTLPKTVNNNYLSWCVYMAHKFVEVSNGVKPKPNSRYFAKINILSVNDLKHVP